MMVLILEELGFGKVGSGRRSKGINSLLWVTNGEERGFLPYVVPYVDVPCAIGGYTETAGGVYKVVANSTA